MKLLSINRRLVMPSQCAVRPIVNAPAPPRLEPPKRANRWGCRDGTCDALTQREAWQIFKQIFGKDLPRDEVVEISRHKEAPWVEEAKRLGIPLSELMEREGDPRAEIVRSMGR